MKKIYNISFMEQKKFQLNELSQLELERAMREMKAGTNYHLPAKGGKYGVKPFVLNLLQEIRSKCKVYKDGCWVWQGRVNKSGNPIVKYKGKVYTVMHKLWSWAYDEPQPTRLYRTKHCYNERCVKPEHLTKQKPTRREQFLKELPNDTELQEAGVSASGEIIGGYIFSKNTSNTPGNRPKMPEMFEGNSYQQWKDIGSRLKKDLTEESDSLD